jgi:hypothetical protein
MVDIIGVAEAEKFNSKYLRDTDSKLKDRLFNWIVARYSRGGLKFNFSDRFVWTGAIYTLPELFGYIVFFVIFLYLAHLSFMRYGEARTIVFFMLLAIWRINVMVKYLAKLNSKFT